MVDTAAPTTLTLGARLERMTAALDAEIAFIKKDSGDQKLELAAGERDARSHGPGGVYAFLLAEAGLPLPDDAAGTLNVGGAEVKAYVVAHEGNRLWVLLETTDPLPDFIPQATLVLSQTELLERLKERVAELSATNPPGRLAEVFGYGRAKTGFGTLPDRVVARVGDGGSRIALEHAVGSDVTLLWGPPGTGKTFTIAALVAALVESGETVLVTSHTHAAVEQALWAAVEPPSDGREPGLLHGSPQVDAGQILKIGPLRDPKIPAECHLDSRLEAEAERRQVELERLITAIAELQKELIVLRRQQKAWDGLAKTAKALADTEAQQARAKAAFDAAQAAQRAAVAAADAARAAVQAAESTFLVGRRRRVEAARTDLERALWAVPDHEAAVARATAAVVEASAAHEQAKARHEAERHATVSLPPEASVRANLARVSARLTAAQADADEIRGAAANLANELVANARALFTTLTKLYMSPQLAERTWDTVIVDEASMAMPPLVALAAARAAKRVVVCGDFFQLPPIVRSREGIAVEELHQSLFDIRGIPDAVAAGDNPEQLARLMVQRRMAPAIAEVARTLAYGSDLVDAPDTVLRQASPAVGALAVGDVSAEAASSPILTVDINGLDPWSGKARGSGSRFNFFSAQTALELAAVYATKLAKPEPGDPRPIGIVTPFAAQKRYISKVLEAMGDLVRWVSVGTVHTFQGNECDVVIFDSVLGLPHWSSRLTNPQDAAQVIKDLNVAVTRARHQFVLVGDAAWLDKGAKAGSGLGLLWTHLRAAGPVIDVREVLGEGFLAAAQADEIQALGWDEHTPSSVSMLDENSFYPAFLADLAAAGEQVVLFTPFIGKTRWPKVEPHVLAAAARGVDVVVLHKPLSDPEWKQKDPVWGARVFETLAAGGVTLVGITGVHAKTIVIDSRLVYEGSLNWASQTRSYEHMLRLESRNVAALVERMMQLREIIPAFRNPAAPDGRCPRCAGPLIVLNQARQRSWDLAQPLKLVCLNYQQDHNSCDGYVRGVDVRPPFLTVPACVQGTPMKIRYTSKGKPWQWECGHRGCRKMRWHNGDIEP